MEMFICCQLDRWVIDRVERHEHVQDSFPYFDLLLGFVGRSDCLYIGGQTYDQESHDSCGHRFHAHGVHDHHVLDHLSAL